jgi:hypothetical protein
MFDQGGWEPELRELSMPLELEELEESIDMVGRGGGSGVAGASATSLGFGHDRGRGGAKVCKQEAGVCAVGGGGIYIVLFCTRYFHM